jgi:peptidoglycan/LPS O-acetylase OafA/YrhL
MTERIASLDLLRAGAAFSVAIAHFLVSRDVASSALEPVAIVSVELFFVLSGFVLAPQILKCVHSRKLHTLSIFLVRRWMRTIPPYLVALGLVTVMIPSVWTDTLRYATYSENLFVQHNTEDYYPVRGVSPLKSGFMFRFRLWLWASPH